MTRHLKAVHSYCPDCEVDLKRRDDLLDHLKEMHCIDIPCELCNKRFFDGPSLKEHFRAAHNDEAKKTCDICGFQASSMANLAKHNNAIHLQKKELKCDQCDYITSWAQALKRHMLARHPPPDAEKFQCDKCAYNTIMRDDFQRHQKTHSSQTYPCDICFKVLKSKRDVSGHKKRMHSHDKETFHCDQCDYVTTQNCYLKQHKTGHEARSKVECHVCHKKVLWLDKHIQAVHQKKERICL